MKVVPGHDVANHFAALPAIGSSGIVHSGPTPRCCEDKGTAKLKSSCSADLLQGKAWIHLSLVLQETVFSFEPNVALNFIVLKIAILNIIPHSLGCNIERCADSFHSQVDIKGGRGVGGTCLPWADPAGAKDDIYSKKFCNTKYLLFW